jgi:hypothetical protein
MKHFVNKDFFRKEFLKGVIPCVDFKSTAIYSATLKVRY